MALLTFKVMIVVQVTLVRWSLHGDWAFPGMSNSKCGKASMSGRFSMSVFEVGGATWQEMWAASES